MLFIFSVSYVLVSFIVVRLILFFFFLVENRGFGSFFGCILNSTSLSRKISKGFICSLNMKKLIFFFLVNIFEALWRWEIFAGCYSNGSNDNSWRQWTNIYVVGKCLKYSEGRFGLGHIYLAPEYKHHGSGIFTNLSNLLN